MSILDKSQKVLARFRGASARPPLEKYYVAALCALIGLSVADLGILAIRPMMLPTKPLPARPPHAASMPTQSLGDYDPIMSHDIFNEDGLIPPELASGKNNNFERPAVLSQLPLQLLGTIVHYDAKKSIATISITSKNTSNSYMVDDVIEGMARVTKIERKRVTFLNLNNNRMEYIEIPDDAILQFGVETAPAPGQVVQQNGQNNFTLRRTDVKNMTKNLASLLQQARVEPVFSPDGISVEGFKFVGIQPGSIYEKLGFKVGDMIKSVNGEPVNSPTKAMEMYNLLKNSSSVQLTIERDGQEQNLNYTVQ